MNLESVEIKKGKISERIDIISNLIYQKEAELTRFVQEYIMTNSKLDYEVLSKNIDERKNVINELKDMKVFLINFLSEIIKRQTFMNYGFGSYNDSEKIPELDKCDLYQMAIGIIDGKFEIDDVLREADMFKPTR